MSEDKLGEFRKQYEVNKYDVVLRDLVQCKQREMALESQVGALHKRLDQQSESFEKLKVGLGELVSRHEALQSRLKEKFEEIETAIK